MRVPVVQWQRRDGTLCQLECPANDPHGLRGRVQRSAEFCGLWSRKILVVYVTSWGLLNYVIGTPGSPNAWGAPGVVGTANYFNKPALVASGPSGIPRVYYRQAGGGTNLVSRDFNISTRTWSAERNEVQDDGVTVVQVLLGAAITLGVDSVALAWFAAIPSPADSGVGIWRLNGSTDRWTELTNVWSTPRVSTNDAPAFAYVPFSPSNLWEGQFHLMYRRADADIRTHHMRTEGNSATTAPNRRMVFADRPTPFFNQWGDMVGSPATIYHNGNLRASVRCFAGRRADGSHDPDNLVFSPVADGIVNAQVKDQNDYTVMGSTLPCSLLQPYIACPSNI